MILQAGGAIPSTPMELILSSPLSAKLVLVILALLSLVSWAVMLAKWLEFRRVGRGASGFIAEFLKCAKLEQAAALAKRSPASPQARVVGRAVDFLAELRPLSLDGTEVHRTRLNAAQVEAVHLVMDAEFTVERDRLGRYVPSLAIIGSASPLLGLFGTVLGVIDAFTGIAAQGSGNLTAVAPGIAQALIATAAALAVAVPAVFGYNLFASRLNRMDGELDRFGAELIALLAREGRI